MLVEFSVGNYLSFKDIVTFSMVSAAIKEHQDTNVFETNHLKLLKSGIIYGANASGKSNLFNAMTFMKSFVLNSSKDSQAEEKISIENFRLNTENASKPSHFEIVFIQNKIKFRYGFEVTISEVVNEWLYSFSSTKESKLFERHLSEVSLGKSFGEGKDLINKTRPNALFLSVIAQFNGETSIEIMKWFNKFSIISGLKDTYKDISTDLVEKSLLKNMFLELIKIADAGIQDVQIRNKISLNFEISPKSSSEFPILKEWQSEHTYSDIITFHKKYDSENNFVSMEEFHLGKQESRGTEKLFSLLGPILRTLQNGNILVVDEFDSRLHTFITRFIISMFNSIDNNKYNAQLIVNTHDTNLLSNAIFRRDQIWFTEKTRYGATDLYSLVEYHVRNDASFEKDYLLGKYGALPFIGDFKFLIDEEES